MLKKKRGPSVEPLYSIACNTVSAPLVSQEVIVIEEKLAARNQSGLCCLLKLYLCCHGFKIKKPRSLGACAIWF